MNANDMIPSRHTILLGMLCFAASSNAPGQSAKDIVTRAENNIRGLSSQMEMTIRIIRPSWTRTMSLKAWSKGEQYSLSVITAPPGDAGTVFLKRIKEIWNWLPSIERAIKLPPSMMAQSWMGTDFTNDDLVKASSRIDDYSHKVVGDSVIEGLKCWEIEMIPLPEAAVVWSRVNIWIDQKNYLELRLEYYDEDNKLVNILQCSDIRTLGGRLLPCKLEMIPAEKKGQETVIIYNNATFNQPIRDDFFTTQNMKKAK
ncbi:MAG TPA: outer membrane lipoprotein-sorting protein [Puia sp.]|nr:outer membrane lipoprotein-sorting protein [Puia sp.]